MLRVEALHEVSDILVPDHFYAHKHSIVYDAMLNLSKNGEPIDILTVTEKLKDLGQLDTIGGSLYVASLTEGVPSATHANHYAETVYKKAMLRALIEAGSDIGEMGYSEPENITDALDGAEKRVHEVTSRPGSQKFIPMSAMIDEAWQRFDKLSDSDSSLRGIPTGYKDLDNLLAGLQKSDLIILAARPSVGKTTLAMDIARHVAVRNNIPVGIFSLEMSSQQLVDRMLAAEARVSSWHLRTGRLTQENDYTILQEALSRMSKAPLFIDDFAGNTIARMRSIARKLKSEHGLGLIVVDYLQLVITAQKYDNMVNQVTEISRSLKQLAKELDVPVLALSQLSRAVEQRGGKPRLSDLRDSGSIEQDADVVMFIHREDKGRDESERTNIAEILIEKHRNGPTGRIELYFDDKTTSFLPIDKTGEQYGSVKPQETGLEGF
ncbi:replicative DNA helicase [Candidatus Nomurabacteria bacterium RIFCSPHIGHO2_02_FULL_33_12]|uniref:Replicative DNA helicase n=1 Tax=Candidatus Nomurabacteria bacterium RIFCSPLOWO2_01_FULL_33_17 TaxID=1801764 RepID=A0A1F6WQZ3_9BACT|nr:MAG: replicative DNA helicase [Candidatus Nomurabacteria bacterium RIFCSPHIGHO2_02_FULL_33_12]OGI84234.1 MAG: replicative DNA helicase [Candidatus Nomurabacteria bacterium RIFCSPLOWO2_01_FULL_33_17]